MEEIINFSEMFEDPIKKNKEYKHCENNPNKYNPAISFIEEDHTKNKRENSMSCNKNSQSENIIKEDIEQENNQNNQNNEFLDNKK